MLRMHIFYDLVLTFKLCVAVRSYDFGNCEKLAYDRCVTVRFVVTQGFIRGS